MQKFKAGDLVYDLRRNGAICEVVANPCNSTYYKLLIVYDNGRYRTYTEDGLFSVDDTLPTLVKATEENREALVSIFGDIFQKLEDDKVSSDSENIIKELINKQGFAWCGVSNFSKNEAREEGGTRLCKIVSFDKDENFISEFCLEDGTTFMYAVPFDPNTGNEITALED